MSASEALKARVEKIRQKGTSFRDSKGIYTWKDEQFMSVTTILKARNKPALTYWAAKMVAERVYELIEEKESGKLSGLQLLKELKDTDQLKKAPWAKRDAKRDIGSTFHDVADMMVHGEKVNVGVYAEDIRPYISSFAAWEEKMKPETIAAECMVVSRKHGYAGTLDRIAELTLDGKKGIYLIDYKTSTDSYDDHALQLSAYAHADFICLPDGSEIPMPKVDGGLILIVGEEAKLARWDIGDETFKGFLGCIEMARFDQKKLQYK